MPDGGSAGSRLSDIRVLVVEDSADMRDALAELIDTTDGMTCAGTAEDGFEAIQMIRLHGPTVILMDLRMPVMGGIDTTRLLRGSGIDVPVVMLTAYGDEGLVAEALDAGVTGYVLKGSPVPEILDALRGAAESARGPV